MKTFHKTSSLGSHIPMKVTIRKNFDFGKLQRGVNKVINKTLSKIAQKSEEITKDNIDGKMRPALKPFTKKMREKGYGWEGKKVGKPITKNIPLKQTGALYRSIKYKKKDDTLEMLAYGLIQNNGFTSMLRKRAKGYKHSRIHGRGVRGISQEKPSMKFIKVPPRPFIGTPISKKHRKELVKIKKQFKMLMRRSLRVKGAKMFKSGFIKL